MAEPKAYLGNDPYIFISYAHRNESAVYPFISALQEKYNVWFDEGIRYGKEWDEEIAAKIKKCALLIYMITEESLNSPNCKDEIHFARELGKPFLNILVKKETNLPDDFTFRYGRFQMCNLFAFPNAAAAVADIATKCAELEKVKRASAAAGEAPRSDAEPAPLEAAQSGDADAQDDPDERSQFSKGVEESCGKAIQWFRKTAEQGHEKAKKWIEKLQKHK